MQAMCLISHWLACIWYMMYRFGGKNHTEDWAFNVLDPGTTTENSALSAYLVAYYQSFLLLVGAASGG